MYQQNQVQNQPTAAYWLSMIGGILGVTRWLSLNRVGAVVGAFTFGFGFAVIGGLGIWILICSIVVIVAAQRLKAKPLEHSKVGSPHLGVLNHRRMVNTGLHRWHLGTCLQTNTVQEQHLSSNMVHHHSNHTMNHHNKHHHLQESAHNAEE